MPAYARAMRAEIERMAATRPWRKSAPTVFFVGRHEPRKGLGVLLDALPHLPVDVKLWIAGDGPETRPLQAKFTGDPRVEWLGRITEEEKAARLRAADVFCAPSLRGESFGIVLLEAMAAGTAIVCSDIHGYKGVVRRGQQALLVPPRDHDALAEALATLIDDPALRARLGASGRVRAEQFSWPSITAKVDEYYGFVIRRLAAQEE